MQNEDATIHLRVFHALTDFACYATTTLHCQPIGHLVFNYLALPILLHCKNWI